MFVSVTSAISIIPEVVRSAATSSPVLSPERTVNPSSSKSSASFRFIPSVISERVSSVARPIVISSAAPSRLMYSVSDPTESSTVKPMIESPDDCVMPMATSLLPVTAVSRSSPVSLGRAISESAVTDASASSKQISFVSQVASVPPMITSSVSVAGVIAPVRSVHSPLPPA